MNFIGRVFRVLRFRLYLFLSPSIGWRFAALKDRLKAGGGAQSSYWLLDSDWEEIDWGGDKDGDRYEANFGQCPCESNWICDFEDGFFNVKPNAQDIDAQMKRVKPPKPEACAGKCKPVQTYYGEWWNICKNRKTGQFRLFTSKRIGWHCELPITDPT